MKKGYMTTVQAARALHVSSETIRRKCVQGRIPGAYQVDPDRGFWKVPRGWVENILEAAKPVVRKREGA